MTNYKNTIVGSAIAGIFAVAFVLAPMIANAADLKLGGWYPESIDSYTPISDSGGWYPESIDSYTPMDSGWYPESIDSYYTPSYYNDSYMPSYGSGGGFGGGSFFTGGGFTGSSGYSRPGNTNINENYCTNGSCNQNINAPTNIVTNYPPQQTYPVYQPVYQQPTVYTQPVQNCYTCGCAGYPACQRPIAYNNAPYVTLSAVPYTGLDLGPIGTAMYWGFLVLWCLIAAYLIAVKKVQNKIAAWFVGSTPSHTTHVAAVAPQAPVAFAAPAAPKVQTSGIDPFIQSQINRAK